MLTSQNQNGDTKQAANERHAMRAPTLSLPKGGGAIHGMGEKFAANPVTGTGSMMIPIATSRGRSGFGPQLSLAYDSGAGNGPFGFGWSSNLPQIAYKTDKCLPPLYCETEEPAVFLLSGMEDLVPLLNPDGSRFEESTSAPGFDIHRFRPRIEGLFARIERWTRQTDGDVHWRSVSKDNVLTLYGKDANSRIADPKDSGRIFSWLICETRDDKGNAVLYEYKREDDTGVDLTSAHERNRGLRDDSRRMANRYLKRIIYGNRASLLDSAGRRPRFLSAAAIAGAGWMFEVVFDYDDHDPAFPMPRDDEAKDAAGALKYPWKPRQDPFSTYRPGFEVRTYRLCQRILMFHHFPEEDGVGANCLVRSTDFTYSHEQEPEDVRNPIYSLLLSVRQCGYKRQHGGYLKHPLPPIEFEYTRPIVQETAENADAAVLENLPVGLDGFAYRWTDLHGEGAPGILTEQAGAWFYKRNLSPVPVKRSDGREHVKARFAPLAAVALKPAVSLASGAQFMDLAGDGLPDVVILDGPTPGFYEQDGEDGWQPFRPFKSRLSRDTRDPNLRFIDLDGDGHADALITENDAFVWHRSLGEDGFGPAHRLAQAPDEESGPRMVFADGTQSIYLADMSGDGLTDLVRIRNSEVCYWPNLGYGRFGAKVTMELPGGADHPQCFDHADEFDQDRIRLADIDGTGMTDIIYLHRDGVHLYFNQSGNSWSAPHRLNAFPRVDDAVSITALDLLGNGTACLTWSSPLPGDARCALRYIDLMGQKPYLLTRVINNLGAETVVQYAPSTKFYLEDKRDGRPWITRIPFPVHVVERVEIYDRVSRNRFVSRYKYHHGYFDGEEREFRGFGMVEQWDTEEIGSVPADQQSSVITNLDAASFVPPVLTRTWFHTGVYLGHEHVSNFFAGLLDATDAGEYFRDPGLSDAEARARLLPDTLLPPGLTQEEEHQACRALKGTMLRQEVYALDGSEKEALPYAVTEQNFAIRLLQRKGDNPHAVFFTHANESIVYDYERALFPVLNNKVVDAATARANPAVQWLPEPRVSHTLALEVDDFGNVRKSASLGYGRRYADLRLPLPADHDQQVTTLITYSENGFTKSHDAGTEAIDAPDAYRTPLPCESQTFEITGLNLAAGSHRFSLDQVRNAIATATFLDYEKQPTTGLLQKRLIEHVRTYYRRNDLTAPLPFGSAQSLALPFESYKLAFTAGLVSKVYGGRVTDTMLEAEGGYVHTEGEAHWWIPSGQVFYSPSPAHTAAQELTHARGHFFLPHCYRDAFGHATFVSYDSDAANPAKNNNLLVVRTEDAVGNVVTSVNDYRVLQPVEITEPNGNRSQVRFDALGMLVGTAVMGKPSPAAIEGDSFANFSVDLTPQQIKDYFDSDEPRPLALAHLGTATTRIVYDLDRVPACAATIARETHVSDLDPGVQTKVQLSFNFSDGFGREVQKKIQAEPGPVPQRDAAGEIVVGADQQPVMTANPVSRRWVGSGWSVFNNKGQPVRQFEPFFSDTHKLDMDVRIGVSPVLFYDPAGRVVATLHPNHTYEKIVFDPWQQATFDVNDTAAPHGRETGDPRTDKDIGGYVARYFEGLPSGPAASPWQPWYAQRIGGSLGSAERQAAQKAATHANTPHMAHFDTLGRSFLSVSHNRVVGANHDLDGTEATFHTRVELDIAGNQRTVRDAIAQDGDALGRIVMCYDYDLLGNRIRQASMEAGARWLLHDVAGKPLYAWDSRGHCVHTAYDSLRRPTDSFLREGAGPEMVVGRNTYGESRPTPEANNLRGRVVELRDQAGVVTSDDYDFKGNLLRSQRRLTQSYKTTLDWSGAVPLEPETYTTRSRFDALNRPTQLIAPHSDQPGTKVNVIQPVYNEANLLEQLHGWLNQGVEPADPLDPSTANLHAVTNIDYDAKGQRTLIQYGNGAETRYRYDPETFRLVHLYTRRSAAFSQDCENPAPPPPTIAAPEWPPPGNSCGLQNLHYTYDPAGNITHIRDDAQQTIFFKNKRVEPSAEYTYDALYRLIEARGREHLGQSGGMANAPIPHSYNDATRVKQLSTNASGDFAPNDGNAMGTYTERYLYDAVGNFLEMQHRGSDPAHPGWTRTYTYNETSLIENGTNGTLLKTSNRLSSTKIGSGSAVTLDPYGYDAHGNMLRMPHLQVMQWDDRDQLRMTQRQKVNDQDADGIECHGERTWYVYDAAGQRMRKVTELSNSGGLKDERIYLGGFEIYRRHSGNYAGLVRETLHIMDDTQRLALVETRTQGNDPAPPQLVRYQFGNHLGSACLELDEQAQIVSYEEYTPYGSTAYQAVRSKTETPKQYRYTGNERDEESGCQYHGARYYLPMLARWLSADSIGIRGGINLYVYAGCRPTIAADPTGKIFWFFVIAVVVVATLTAVSEAGAPTNKKEAEAVKPHISDTEFAAHTAVTGVSIAVGGRAGRAVPGSSFAATVDRGIVSGAATGATQAVGDRAIQDVKKGEVSSGADYAEDARKGATEGAVTGGILAAVGHFLGRLFSFTRGTPSEQPPRNPFDKEAWDRYYKANPNAPRDLSAAQNRDATISREVSREDFRKALQSGVLTPRQEQIRKLWEDTYGRESVEQFKETGKMPWEPTNPVENSHPYSQAAEPEVARWPGDPIPYNEHRFGVHGGDTRVPLHGDPRNPDWDRQRGFLILDKKGVPVQQIGPEGFEKFQPIQIYKKTF